MTLKKRRTATTSQFDQLASPSAANYAAPAAPDQLALADGDAAQYGDSPAESDGQPFDGAVYESWFAPSEYDDEDEGADAASDDAATARRRSSTATACELGSSSKGRQPRDLGKAAARQASTTSHDRDELSEVNRTPRRSPRQNRHFLQCPSLALWTRRGRCGPRRRKRSPKKVHLPLLKHLFPPEPPPAEPAPRNGSSLPTALRHLRPF